MARTKITAYNERPTRTGVYAYDPILLYLDQILSSIMPSRTGQASKVFAVKADESGFEWVTMSGGVSDGNKGDITVSSSGTVWTINNGAVSNAKAANMAADTIKGRANGAGTGAPQDLTASQVRTIINVANGATANQSDGFLLDRSNHSGSQTASTISDFVAAVEALAPAETTTTIGGLINGASVKNTPVDADFLGLMDSAASNVLKKLSWANVKATLKTYFDTLYTGAQNLFSSIAVSGQATVTVSSPTTQLTFVAGTNMTITTNNTTKEIMFESSGGGSGLSQPQVLARQFFGI